MDPKRLVAPDFGRAVRTLGPYGYVAFQPAPMPRTVGLDPDTVLRLSDAYRALGRLAGTGRLLPNPHLLIQPYITREALASSRIEGTPMTWICSSSLKTARCGGRFCALLFGPS